MHRNMSIYRFFNSVSITILFPRNGVKMYQGHQEPVLNDRQNGFFLLYFRVIDMAGPQITFQDVYTRFAAEPNRFYCCYLCDRAFSSYQDMIDHVGRSHSDPKISCTVCSFVTKNAVLFNKHMNKHKGPRRFQCPQCIFSTNYNSHYKTHIAAVHEGKRLICEFCAYTADTKSHLRMHVFTVHTLDRLTCRYCQFETKFPVNLKKHIVSKHPYGLGER